MCISIFAEYSKEWKSVAKKSAKMRNTLSFFLLKMKPNVKFLVVISAS